MFECHIFFLNGICSKRIFSVYSCLVYFSYCYLLAVQCFHLGIFIIESLTIQIHHQLKLIPLFTIFKYWSIVYIGICQSSENMNLWSGGNFIWSVSHIGTIVYFRVYATTSTKGSRINCRFSFRNIMIVSAYLLHKSMASLWVFE